MLSVFDSAVIGFYFVFLLGVGWGCRRFTTNSSEYFRGGGQMAWWLVGASAFMASFSAWTFTGAAGLAFDHGLIVLTIYWTAGMGFVINALWFSARFRQMRVITVMEAVRQRLGAGNEQFFTWIGISSQILGAAIWLYGLAIFCSPVFGISLWMMVLICGTVVVFVSATGGSWAVAAGDFLQALVLIPITLVTSAYALHAVGGVGSLLERLPAGHFDLTASQASGFGWFWLVALVLERILGMNSLPGAARYLSVRNGRQAQWASWLAAAMFFLGSLIWFIPSFVARAQGRDLAALFPALNAPAEATYVVMAQSYLPAGLFGLMVTAMISATLSSMDTGLNRNAGVFVRSFYLPVLRPQAGERELVIVGKMTTVAMGGVVILLALLYSTWKGLSIFNLMMNFMAVVAIPYVIPLFWSLFVRRSPHWVAWSTTVACLVLGALLITLPNQPAVMAWAQGQGLGPAVGFLADHDYAVVVSGNALLGTLWYLGLSRLFGHHVAPAQQQQIDRFFAVMNRPVAPDEEPETDASRTQSSRMGKMAMAYAAFIALFLAFPNDATGRLAILFCAAFVGGTGFVLYRWAGRRLPARAIQPAPTGSLPGPLAGAAPPSTPQR